VPLQPTPHAQQCATQAFTNDSDPLGDVIITITTDTLPTVFNVLTDLTYVKASVSVPTLSPDCEQTSTIQEIIE
jgi:hypothetical protein